MYNSFSFMSTIIPLVIVLIFIILFGKIAKKMSKMKEDNSFITPIWATVTGKRTHVIGFNHIYEANKVNVTNPSYTLYFVTFLLDDGQKKEFTLSYENYKYLIEGDEGVLSYKGKVFIDFDRKK